jgi:hypothetical protein
LDDGKGLANNTLRGVDKMDFQEIISKFKSKTEKLRDKKDQEFAKKMNAINLIPNW